MSTAPFLSTRLRVAVLIVALLVATLAGGGLAAGDAGGAPPPDPGPPASAGTGSPAAGGSQPLAPAAAQLSPPDCDDKAPGDVDGRSLVQDTRQYPYSAIGYVSTKDGDGPSGTGFVVSDYHVMTAAHVVTESGDGDPVGGIEFTPGLDDPPGSSETAPFGSARAEAGDVTVPEKWDGGYTGLDWETAIPDDPLEVIENLPIGSGTVFDAYDDVEDFRNDVALVRLDRPIGTATGSFEFDYYDSKSDTYEKSLSQAGYPCTVAGQQMLETEIDGAGTRESIHFFAPSGELAPVDSGSPIWYLDDGDAVAVSVTGAHWGGAARFSQRRLELFEERILEDERPESSPELDVLGRRDLATDDHPDWVRDRSSTPDSVVSHRQEVVLRASLYNEGYGSSTPDDQPGEHDTFPYHEPPEVEFFVATDREEPHDSRLDSVCSDSAVPGQYDDVEVSCRATLDALEGENIESVDEFAFFATVHDPDASDDHRPRLVGTASNDAESAGPPAVDAVDAARLADRPGYARAHVRSPDTVEDSDETVQLATTVYNAGLSDVPLQETPPIPTDAYAEIEFYVTDVAPYGDFEVDPEAATLVCSDRVGVEKLDDATASCTGTLEDAALAGQANFYAHVDHSTAADDHEPRFVGAAEVSPGSQPSVAIDEVTAPDRVSRNAEYQVAAAVSSDAELEAVEVPARASASQGSCAAASNAVTVRPGEQTTVAVECSAPSDPGDGPATVEISVGGATATTEVEVTEIDYTADVQLVATDYRLYGVPDPEVDAVEVGDEFGLEAKITNEGSDAGRRRVAFRSEAECANLDAEVIPRHEQLQAATVVELAPGESTDLYFHCDVPLDGWLSDYYGPATGMMVPESAEDPNYVSVFPEGHEIAEFDLIERAAPPTLRVEGVDAPATATAGAPIEVDPTVVNDGGPGDASVRLLVDGEVVDEARTSLNRYEEFPYLRFEYVPGPEDVGERTLTVETGDDSHSATVEVDPSPLSVAIDDAPDAVASSQETVAVDAAVSNDGDGPATRSVALVLNGTHVDAAEVTVDPGATTGLDLEGAVPDHVDDAVAVRVEALGDADETVVDVVPPQTAVEIVDAPATAEPNGSVLVDATVTNEDDHAATVRPRVFLDDREWGALGPVELAPGETERVRTRTAVPRNATAGDTLDVRIGTGTDVDAATVAVDARRAWAYDGPNGTLASAPTIANGTVVAQTAEAVVAADAETGEELWTRDAARRWADTAPTLAGDTVYAGGETVRALDLASGESEWTFEPNGSVATTSPTASRATVYVAADRLYALDADTGAVQWSYNQSAARFTSAPTVSGETVYVGSADGRVLAVDATTGAERWSFDEPADSVRSAPTVGDVTAGSSDAAAGETVFVGSLGGALYAVNATRGETTWRYEAPEGEVRSSPTYVEGSGTSPGTVLVGSHDGTLHAVEAATGASRWTVPLAGSVGTSSPTVAGDTVYLGARGLYAVDLASGALAWTVDDARAAYSSPTVADGRVYVGSAGRDGGLYAVDADHEDTSHGSRVELGTLGHVGPRAGGTGPTVGDYEPRQVVDDGRYRDVDGDGEVTQVDVVVFFQHHHRDAWQRPELFDFSDSGSVGHGDVIALFEYAATG